MNMFMNMLYKYLLSFWGFSHPSNLGGSAQMMIFRI